MPRRTLATAAILAALATATGAAAQEAAGPLDRIGRVDAVEYVRGLLQSDSYDPRDRERALNGAQQLPQHWRRSIFDGRRTRATRGTGLHLPDFSPGDGG